MDPARYGGFAQRANQSLANPIRVNEFQIKLLERVTSEGSKRSVAQKPSGRKQ